MHTRRRVNVILVVLAILVILACVGCCEEDDWECIQRTERAKKETKHNQGITLERAVEIIHAQETADFDPHNRSDPPFTPSPEQ